MKKTKQEIKKEKISPGGYEKGGNKFPLSLSHIQ